jgi:hypothetical protein
VVIELNQDGQLRDLLRLHCPEHAASLLSVALDQWLKPTKDSGGEYQVNSLAAQEIALVWASFTADGPIYETVEDDLPF